MPLTNMQSAFTSPLSPLPISAQNQMYNFGMPLAGI